MPGGPFFSVLVSNFKTALHIRDMLLLNILMKKALAVTAGMLGTLSLLNGALVQVQQVSSCRSFGQYSSGGDRHLI